MNPWFDKDNPYITNKGFKTIYHNGPLACVLDHQDNPLFDPNTVDADIKRFDDLALEHGKVYFEARRRRNYLYWKKWEEEHK